MLKVFGATSTFTSLATREANIDRTLKTCLGQTNDNTSERVFNSRSSPQRLAPILYPLAASVCTTIKESMQKSSWYRTLAEWIPLQTRTKS